MTIRSDTPTIATRLNAKERKALELLAGKNERSLAGELRYAVRLYLDSQKDYLRTMGAV